MKTKQVVGLMPESGREVCIVASHESRATVIRRLLHGVDCMMAAFETAEDLTSWVGGHGVLKMAVSKGVIVWVTDKVQRVSKMQGENYFNPDSRGSYFVPAGKWIGYRWIPSDPMLVAILNARTAEILKHH